MKSLFLPLLTVGIGWKGWLEAVVGGIEEGKSIQKQLQPSEDDPSYMKKLILEDFKDRTEKNLIFSFLT